MFNSNFTLKKHRLRTSILFAFAFPTAVWASATLDGSMGSTGSYSGTGLDFTITETVGKLEGANLFHSFSDFSVNSGENATFTGTSPINNVISRVTGSSSTEINGGLTSTITGANFYFINPNGIVFKEGAAINVDGSFYASTADYLRLDEGEDGKFYANTSSSGLVSTPPISFGFLSNDPNSITLKGTQLLKGFNLIQPDGATFGLIGGDIVLKDALAGTTTQYGSTTSLGTFISMTGNRFEMISVGSSGEAIINGGDYDLTSFNSLGDVSIVGESIIDATDIYIRSGNVEITDSIIAPGYFYLPYYYSSMGLWYPVPGPGQPMTAPPSGGTIDIQASNGITITGTKALDIKVYHPGYEGYAPYGLDVFSMPRPNGKGYLSGITTYAGDFASLYFLGQVHNVADIKLEANNILLTGSAIIMSERYGPGAAGVIDITAANKFEVRDGALVFNLNMWAGTGGNIIVNASEVILDAESDALGITGLNASSTFNPMFGYVGFDQAFAYADAGNIIINSVDNPTVLTVRGGAEIKSESHALGQAGNIDIYASNINLSRDGMNYGAISSQSVYAGDAGNININSTGDINISGGFVIEASTIGTGDGGDISITADQAINITGENSGIASSTIKPSDKIKDVLAHGFASDNYDSLISDMNAYYNQYFSGTLVQPDADMYTVMAALQYLGFLPLNDPSPSAGNAGSITLAASTLNMSNSSRITSSTTDGGDGGFLKVNVNDLVMSSNAEIRSRSGILHDGNLIVGSGDGGSINIEATNSLFMTSGASISASSLGSGLAGDIYVDAGRVLNLTDSNITTEALLADGGDITIRAIDMIYLDKSNITTSVGNGTGSGGNIDIDPKFFIIESSNILANAYGGTGGNITIVAENLLSSADSTIDASSALGVDGNVNITSPDEDVAEELVVLTDNYLDVTSLISERCGTSTGSSSLVNAGPAGMAIDPDGYLPSFSLASYDNNLRTSDSRSSKKHWAKPYIDESNMMLAQLSCNTL